jgi:glycine/D-amino acid oxidase-like deaminating enzyme
VQTVFDRKVDPALILRSLERTAFGSVWLDMPRPEYPRLTSATNCDLLVVGAGYTGLWTALHAVERNPGARVVVIEAERVGWAASGRNGGFVESSITHGIENGKTRWPDEFDHLEQLGLANLDGMQADIERYGMHTDWERSGMLSVATEPHQVDWLRDCADEGEGKFLDQGAVRAEVNSPTYLAGLLATDTCAIVHPAKLVFELARACTEAGVQIFEHTAAEAIDRDRSAVWVQTAGGGVTAERVVLATNVFPSLLRRNKFHTVPVYDYALATEPLTDAQLGRIGWQSRAGLSDCANQFHYYRLSADNRIIWGGYDALYFWGRKVSADYEDQPATFRKLAAHFFITFPQLEDVRFSHRWAGAIDANSRFCAHWGLAGAGRIAYVNGFTGLGVGASRFAADVCLDLLDGRPTERTELEMVRTKPMPFPPEPFASVGIQATRWSLDRADHNEGKRNVFLRTMDALGLGFDS